MLFYVFDDILMSYEAEAARETSSTENWAIARIACVDCFESNKIYILIEFAIKNTSIETRVRARDECSRPANACALARLKVRN